MFCAKNIEMVARRAQLSFETQKLLADEDARLAWRSTKYKEGVLVGYRWYDAKNIEPLFPFGYGLSYTTFAYKNLKVSLPAADHSVTVKFTVANTGNRAGAEVAQLYVSLPSTPKAPQPPRALKGFSRIDLA